jgi:DNA-binding HxlR family transcriptional regulator
VVRVASETGELTELGRTLIDPIRTLAQWAEANGEAILDAQDRPPARVTGGRPASGRRP